MILRWFIFFSPVLGLAAATVGGRVELTNSHDAAVRKHNDYSGVVLWLEPAERAAPAPSPKHAAMKQRDKSFMPHVLAVPVGSSVDFPNLDPIFHNAFSNFSGGHFDVGLYAPGTSRTVVFRTPGVVRVFCNIHPTMSAIIVVVPSAWFTVTSNNGQYDISDVPPGDYLLKIFHERALPENLNFLEHRVTVPAAGLTLPLISISETGFIPVPHLNKFNHPYPPASPGGSYVGGK